MKTTFTLLFSLLSFAAFAQQNYVPGYYITNQGDKVEAQINDQNWDRNPTFIEVKRDANAVLQKLTVTDIKGFALSTGDVYEAYIVDIDKSPTKLDNIEVNSQPVMERDTVFLRAVVKGTASLYYLRDQHAKVHYFLKKGEEVPGELFYRIVKFQDENKTGYSKQRIYRGLLKAQLTECPEIAEKFTNLAFTEKALKAVVIAYNQCVGGTEGEYVAEEEKIKNNLLALAGGTYTNLSFGGEGFKDLIGKEFNSANYTFGVSLLSTLPRARGKWAIRNDLMFKPLKANNIYETGRDVNQENYTKVETTLDMGYVGLNTSLRYKILEAGIKPYFGLGMANNVMVYNNSIQKSFRRYHTIENTREESPLNEYRTYEQALFVIAGLEIKRILAEIKFEQGNGFSPYTLLSSKRNTFSVQLGYTLK